MSNTKMLGRNAGAGVSGGTVDEEDEEELEDVTETVVDAVVVPELLVAVNVYVVLAVGATVVVPADAMPLPTPWSI